MLEIKGIKYIAPFLDQSGYGQAARGNILSLHKAEVPLTLKPISFEEAKPDLGAPGKIIHGLINKKIDYNIVLVHTTPEFWSRFREPSKVSIGYTIWETSKLHPDWPGYINNNVDKVLVGSEWNVDVFKDNGVSIPIGVVPHGISMSEFKGITPYNIEGISSNTFIFYNIFQWTERKNPLALIKGFWYAFRNNENVALVIKTYGDNYNDEEKDKVRNTIRMMKNNVVFDGYPPLYLITNMLSREEILGLHSRGDCFVSLDRGEGFGLPGFEAGAAGNPIIVTGWGGVTEYAKPGNSFLIPYTLTPVFGMPWSPWYRGNQLWAEPDVVTAAEVMRHVYKNREVAKETGARLKKYIVDNFSWEKIGETIIKEIKEM